MEQQNPPQGEKVHSGKQVILRLLLFVVIIVAIVILYKTVVM